MTLPAKEFVIALHQALIFKAPSW